MLKHENIVLHGIILSVTIIASALLFGIAGLRTVIGIILMSIPFYLIFSSFALGSGEKIIFSFFTAIAVFPSLVYWLGFVTPFRISVLIVFAALLLIGFLICRKYTISL